MTRSFCRKASNFVDMVKFIGEYSGKIDDKGRVILPSAFKNLLSGDEDMRFVVKKDIFEDCLEMYTFSEWERQSEELKSKLYPGAAVGNPIDIIGTGTPEHLATAIDYCENRFENRDLMMVIFGSPGLVKLYDAYEVLHRKMEECR